MFARKEYEKYGTNWLIISLKNKRLRKEALNAVSFLPNFESFYILFFCYFLQEFSFLYFSFTIYDKENRKMWLVNFPIFIAVTLEHIRILIAPAGKWHFLGKRLHIDLKAENSFKTKTTPSNGY